MPIRILVTQDATADCTQAGHLMKESMSIIYWLITVMTVMFIIEQAKKQKMNVVISPKK